MPQTTPSRADGAELFSAAVREIISAVSLVVTGKTQQVERAVLTLLAEGHLLIEDVPGVGKTQLARALAAAINTTAARIQFTPDLLPSDVTGVGVFHPAKREFEFKAGPIFRHIVIADEINRASPKTQSALLEAMAEHQVSIDGVTRSLSRPFFVIATQNPVEMEGTYALPEAQRDRFTMRISMGYPDEATEAQMLRDRAHLDPLEEVRPVIDTAGVGSLIDFVARVHLSPAAEQYIVALVARTREHPSIRLGASPRATIQLARTARAHAALAGRDFVLPDDITALVQPVLAHRIVLARGLAHDSDDATDDILNDIVARTPVPQATRA